MNLMKAGAQEKERRTEGEEKRKKGARKGKCVKENTLLPPDWDI